MNKRQLYQFFDKKITKQAIKNIDDEWQIVGKFCRVSVMDGLIDIWLCSPGDMVSGLSPMKLTYMLKGLKTSQEAKLTELDGEAYIQTRDKRDVLQNLSVLGIKRKRHVSEETVERLRRLA